MLKAHMDYLKQEPYALDRIGKRAALTDCLQELVRYHKSSCPAYAHILDAMGHALAGKAELEDLPFLPVQLFKELDLLSVPRETIVKVMESSGTSGQRRSRVFLDHATAHAQSRCLSSIMASFIGKKRLPMIILDTELARKDPRIFSARGAGIVGFSMFGRDVFFALDEKMVLRWAELREYLESHAGERVILFGYTYIIWQHVVKALREHGAGMGLPDGHLFHIGGWKKLHEESVSPKEYNQAVQKACGNVRIHNYYGMAEQLGSVFVECEEGHLHCSVFSDILVRDAMDFHSCGIGEEGLLELLSVLPSSYPGHILLTEDWGRILGEDDCPCGRRGKYFELLGRIRHAEIRGCSDTYGQ